MRTPRLRHLAMFALLATPLLMMAAAAQQQQSPQEPPPSIANEPPPEPGADELNAAARKGDVAAVKALLDKGINPNAKWRYGMTALFPACDRGHVEVVKLLLERGASANVSDRFYKASPMNWAINKGHAEIAALLLEKGARNSDQVLLLGVQKAHVKLVRASMAKGGLQPYDLTAAFVQATRDGRTEIAAILQEGGAKPPPTVQPEVLAQFAGNYRAPSDPDLMVIALKNGELEGISGSNVFHLFADGEMAFRPIEVPAFLVKFVKEGGAIASLDLVQGESTTNYKKVEAKP